MSARMLRLLAISLLLAGCVQTTPRPMIACVAGMMGVDAPEGRPVIAYTPAKEVAHAGWKTEGGRPAQSVFIPHKTGLILMAKEGGDALLAHEIAHWLQWRRIPYRDMNNDEREAQARDVQRRYYAECG